MPASQEQGNHRTAGPRFGGEFGCAPFARLLGGSRKRAGTRCGPCDVSTCSALCTKPPPSAVRWPWLRGNKGTWVNVVDVRSVFVSVKGDVHSPQSACVMPQEVVWKLSGVGDPNLVKRRLWAQCRALVGDPRMHFARLVTGCGAEHVTGRGRHVALDKQKGGAR